MNFSEVIKDSFSYPFKNIISVLYVFFLLLGGIIIIPAFIAYGYLIKIAKYTIEGNEDFPELSDMGKLIGEGFSYFILVMVYKIPFYAISLLLVSRIDILMAYPYAYLAVIVATDFVLNIFFIMGLGNMVHDDNKLTAAFDFKRIFGLIKTVGWKKYLALVLIYTIIMQVVALAVNLLGVLLGLSISILGILVANAIFNCYFLIWQVRFVGLIYPDKLESSE